MTLLKNFLGLISLTTLLFSCQKEMSFEEVKSPVIIEADWQFTESGKTYKGEIDTAFITELTGFNIITLHGVTADGVTGQIILEVAGETINVGIYTGDFINFIYGETGGIVYSNIPGSTDFSVAITFASSDSIAGTFLGTVLGADGTEKTIVDGKFSSPVGKENVEIILPNPDNDDYFQLGTKWEYQNIWDANDKVIITRTADTVINVNGSAYTYAVFENNRTQQHRYYRKEGNDFYEYSLVTLGGDTSPDELDLLILKQDGEVGDSWESDPYSFSVSGIPSLSAKIRASIEARDYSTRLNGIQYENLIQVDQQLYVEIDGDYTPDDILTTIYSKGIGIVQYNDLALGGTYILKSYTP